MNLSLRAKLRLPEGCSSAELQAACGRYCTIYRGVLNAASDPAVKAIAQSKLEDLLAAARLEGVSVDERKNYDWDSQAVNIPASAEAALAELSTDGRITDSAASRLSQQIAQMPDSAKRHYLSALIVLKSREASVDTYEEVVRILMNAVRSDPENPVYSMIIADIEQEISRHKNALQAWREEQLAIIKRQQFWETVKKVLSVAGQVALWLVGAAFTVAAGILSCMCSAMEGC